MLDAIATALEQAIGSEMAEKSSVETSAKTSAKTSVKTPQALLELLRQHPQMSLAQAAGALGLSVRAIEMASAKLVKAGKLKHIRPQKGGHWDVIA